jgi:hypothetical protein
MGKRDDIVKVMQSWIGKKESDGSFKTIIDAYNAERPLPAGYAVKYTDAWCDTTVSAAAIVAGVSRDVFPRECGCGRHIVLFKGIGAWVENDAYIPSPGDVIFYDWQDGANYAATDNTGAPDHVGLVESCDGKNITVIEGNMSNAVGRRTIAVNGKFIHGFAVPKYDGGATAAPKSANGPLVVHTNISPNKSSPRNHAIDTITIHCVVGQCAAETLGNIFKPVARQASSNYGVDKDGRVGMYVEEKDCSWCTSSGANDHRAITIEVASDTTAPYKVTDKALAATIELCADICRRNGIKQLLWKGDKNLIGQVSKQNMSVHRWFANKSCPGDYLYERHSYIADEVNKRLGTAIATPVTPTAPAAFIPYTVRVTASELNIRKGAGTGYAVVGSIKDKGVYTIVEEASGAGASKWGKLKSGAGWIALDFTVKA